MTDPHPDATRPAGVDLAAVKQRTNDVPPDPALAWHGTHHFFYERLGHHYQADVRALLGETERLRREHARLRAAAIWTVDRADEMVDRHCGPAVDQQFCEEYGCGTLVELVEHLRAALADAP